VARTKKTVIQRAFTFMEMREDFLESDDLEVRGQSLKAARNMRALKTRAIEARPGTFYVRELPGADAIVEIRPATGLKFGMVIFDDALRIYDSSGDVVYERPSPPWSDATDVWHVPFRQKVVLGSKGGGIHVLEYDEGAWTFAPFAFSPSAGGELAQPYWAYEKDSTIQPTALSGSIVVTASRPIWTTQDVGQRIRYTNREIIITERLNATQVRGTVVNELPPSFTISVENTTEYRVGDAVVAADTNFQGVIIAISGLDLSVVTSAFFEGPDVGEELSSPSGSSEITAKTSISPLPSPIWDEPLMSPKRGYPRAGFSASNRLGLIDFQEIPDLIVLSSAREIEDFDVGAGDDDAIVRQVGDSAPRWLHALTLGDIILFSDNGIYNVPTRENGVISPSTFNPVFVDETGCSAIRPVKVEDGIVFIDSSGEQLKAVMLDGNVYLKWSVRSMAELHDHQIKTPRALCGPAISSKAAEKYLFVINGDGTLAAVSWVDSLRDESVGFAPWDTAGSFVSVAPLFDGYWALVDRVVDGTTKRFLERFSDDAFVDCAVDLTLSTDGTVLTVNGDDLTVNGEPLVIQGPPLLHLAGADVAYYAGGWDAGDFEVDADGNLIGAPSISGPRQAGLNFTTEVSPWPVELIDSPRVGSIKARVMELIVSVQSTLAFSVSCNGVPDKLDAYGFGDDLSAPPALKTGVYRFTVYGNRDHPDLKIMKPRPGPLRILAIGQKVQG
jgi:hypothetical protein